MYFLYWIYNANGSLQYDLMAFYEIILVYCYRQQQFTTISFFVLHCIYDIYDVPRKGLFKNWIYSASRILAKEDAYLVGMADPYIAGHSNLIKVEITSKS